LVRISDPKAAKGTVPYWKYNDSMTDAEHAVPARFEVEVIDGWVKLTKSAAA
jgi:hypothetical protein